MDSDDRIRHARRLARYGSLRLDADGSFTYYPLQGYTGADSFRVTAVYGDSASEEAVISFVCS
ncbi:MAG: Ig-like domain-containing protein [Acutalibacteraceae bacterium]